jgi:hypothetical protein
MNFAEMSENHKKLWVMLSKIQIGRDVISKDILSFLDLKIMIFNKMFPDIGRVQGYCFLCEYFLHHGICPGTDSSLCKLDCLDGLYKKVEIAFGRGDQEDYTKLCLDIANLHLSSTKNGF